MLNKILSRITVSTEIFHIEPLQAYVGFLAHHCLVPDNKLMHLNILIEEVFSHIVSKAFDNKPDGTIDITVSVTHANFVLQFHYMGIPFGYSLERIADVQDEISLTLIRQLSTSYSMSQEGKKGQTVEVKIGIPSQFIETLKSSQSKPTTDEEVVLANDETTLRPIKIEELEMLVQCLYEVFGYTYSGDAIYYPEMLKEKMNQGVYKGFVAVNSEGKVVAHVAMLKNTPDDVICECGQAFVTPAYGKRSLFNRLKRMLIDKAKEMGLYGVYSSAVTGHPYTQKANLSIGCVETGFELGYIPAQLKSVIERKGQDQRQSVVSFFYCTRNQEKKHIYAPDDHREIIAKTYRQLAIEREFASNDEFLPLPDIESVVDMAVKTEWNQVQISIKTPGKDLDRRVSNIIRQATVSGAVVFYLSVSLCDPQTPQMVAVLQHLGFFYSGIMPNEINGEDAIRLQYLCDSNIDPEYVVAVSDWCKELKDYVFECKMRQDKKILTLT